jgi:hypothetical protein
VEALNGVGAPAAIPDPTPAVWRCEPDGAVLEFAGSWLSQRGLPEPVTTLGELRSGRVHHVELPGCVAHARADLSPGTKSNGTLCHGYPFEAIE